ncbi:MAG: cupin domain-containing protein [Synechococcus sp.]
MPESPEALIERLALQPHPEGGWYRELHRSAIAVQRSADGAPREGLTVIVFLLQAGERSCWHRVLQADEVWHHGGGAPLQLWRLPPTGGVAEELRLGPLAADDPQQQPLQLIPANWWQAARSLGAWSLSYCCVGPGFAFADFEMLDARPEDLRPAGARPDLL